MKFDHNLDDNPLEIRSNTAKGTKKKVIWIQGTIAEPVNSVDHFSIRIVLKDYSVWLERCNNAGELFLNPEQVAKKVIWTVFKTPTEIVIECNGVFCLRYKYSDSTAGNPECNVFSQPSTQIVFVDDNDQAAEDYRAAGTVK